MAEPFLGEIKMVGFNFPPRNWAQCDGQMMSIQEYPALYTLLGTDFGGNGTSNFQLPDLRGRVPMHTGVGMFNDLVTRGESYGFEEVALNHQQMPTHTHDMYVSGQLGTANAVGGKSDRVLAESSMGLNVYGNATNLVSLNSGTTAPVGEGKAHYNIQPSLVINFIIALSGTFPNRN